MKTNFILQLSVIALYLVLSGCSPKISYSTVASGLLASEATTITAEDGSFVIQAGKTFKTPFHNTKPFFETSSQPLVSDVYKLTSGEMKGFQWKRVKVKTPYHSEDLYGVISFSNVQSACQNEPVTRSYRISVPEEYVQSALGGRVSCVYEYYSCNGVAKIATWVLWLSDTPF